MTEQRLNIDGRYKLKDDCVHDMDNVAERIKDIHKTIEQELPKRYASLDKLKPLAWLLYTTAGATIVGLVGAVLTLILGKR